MGRDNRLDKQRAAAPEVPKHHSRKDRRRWCRGKPGVEHGERQLVLNSYAGWWSRDGGLPCRVAWSGAWRCAHEEACSVCGKVLRRRLPTAECPDYRP
jgi:hypothetical protein